MAKLTADQLTASHAWLHDIFVWGGIIPASQAKRTNYQYMYGNRYSNNRPSADVICDAVLSRKVTLNDMKNIDKALDTLCNDSFIPELNTSGYQRGVLKAPSMLAKYLANFCVENKLLWDDSRTSTYEMDEIKETIIGKALFDFNCFASQARIAKQQTQTTRQAGPRVPGQAPQNNYKSSGPQSGNMKCIVGQPNQKLAAAGQFSFCIEADKIGKNTPNAFIKPLDDKACPNGIATVYMGSGNGYTDCKCWFDDLNDAQAFLNECQNKFGSKFTNIHIAKAKSDSNGYFIAKTEFGECGIKASKLNEAIENNKNKVNTVMDIALDDVELYENALYHYN